VKAQEVRRADRTSRTKVFHIIQVRHRDQVESPLTDWLREAYEFAGTTPPTAGRRAGASQK
jgi:hypothetical protein